MFPSRNSHRACDYERRTLERRNKELQRDLDAAMTSIEECTARREAASLLAKEQTETIRAIRQALGKVTTLDGVGGPIVALIEGLCNDHSELEARIEAVLVRPPDHYDETRSLTEPDPSGYWNVDEVRRLLRGGSRVPDTVAELDP